MNTPASTAQFVQVKQEGEKTCLVLEGEWTIHNAAPIEHAIDDAKHTLSDRSPESIRDSIDRLDTSGALLLKRLLPDKDLQPHLQKAHQALLEFLPEFSEYKPPPKERQPIRVAFFTTIGEKTCIGLNFMWAITAFIGQVSVRFFRNLSKPAHFRPASIARHIQETGINALSIVGLLAVMISMVITYQGAIQLKKLGASIYTVDLTVIGLLREMGVLVTAIMVAGRSGSAFAAEIGVMKLRDEVNALQTMGMDPIEVLVLPRVLALVLTLPLLTFLADIIGLAGGAVIARSLVDISFHQYLVRIQQVATPTTFFVGIIKAPVFAFLIAIIGCYQGLNVSGSAENIGRRTTLAVVQSIFIVITADAFFSIVFSHVGI